MTTATLEKINLKSLEQFVPRTDYLEMKNIPSNKGQTVLEISSKTIGINVANLNKIDDFVDLEIALRKGKRVGLFTE